MRLIQRERGIAMLYALLLMVVIMGVATLMFARTLGEIKQSGDDAAIVQSLMLARGAANLGGTVLQQSVRNHLQAIVQSSSSTTGQWSFGTSAVGAAYPTASSVAAALSTGSGSVAGQLQPEIDTLVCGNQVNTTAGGYGEVRIYVSSQACAAQGGPYALPSGINLPAAHFVSGSPRSGSGTDPEQVYALPFVLVADGYVGQYHRNVVIQGEYDFTVGRPSFAKYALFTNVHELAGGGNVWFTDNTLFDGPVHTNQYFRFYHKPWFGGQVTSAGCGNPGATACSGSSGMNGAEFYGERSFISNPGPHPSFSNSYGTQAPQLTAGVDWSSAFVPLPQNSTDQSSAAQNGGLYFSSSMASVKMWAADGSGNPLTQDSNGNWQPAATYQYIQACTGTGSSSCSVYRYASDGTLYEQNGTSWSLVENNFNGVVYVNGSLSRLTGPARTPAGSTSPSDAPPALASFAQITVAGSSNIRVTGDLTYEDQPCTGELHKDSSGNVVPPDCSNNLNAQNVLGVYSQGGNVLIGNYNSDSTEDAPPNVKIDGVLMSGTGTVSVENYSRGSPQGTVHLLGGVIEYNYGAFGTFNASTGQDVSGYSRTFTYDQRMAKGLAPPHFPTTGGDEVKNVALFSYGQREQVY